MSGTFGRNRTGAHGSPGAEDMREAAREASVAPSVSPDARDLRKAYARESDAVGTLPGPATARGVARALLQAAQGERGAALLDKLGERAASGRAAVRLLEMALDKWEVFGTFRDGPHREELEEMRGQKVAAFQLCARALTHLGADPSALTPSADLAAMATAGIRRVMADPRTSLVESLEALYLSAQAETAAWELLVEMSRALALADFLPAFEEALDREEAQLSRIRLWVAAGLSQQAGRPLRPARRPPRDRAALAGALALRASPAGAEISGREARERAEPKKKPAAPKKKAPARKKPPGH